MRSQRVRATARRRAAARRRVALLVPRSRSPLALRAERAGAVILPATTIDGPSEDIVGFGGVAMAEDGTGGLVYLKRVGGVAHVFVVALRRQATGWRRSASTPNSRSRPAGRGSARPNGGELIVVWATPFATENEPSGRRAARRDARPRRLGLRAGDDRSIPTSATATGTSPDLAMSSTGQADVVYRVVNNARRSSVDPAAAPGRRDRGRARRALQRRNAGRDSARSTATPASRCARRPQANAPQIAIGPTGNGVVVWQEPDIERRRADLGTAPVRQHARLRAAGERGEPQRRADQRRRGRSERRDLAARPGRGRLPPGRRPRLAAAGPADLPEHAARRRIGGRLRVRRRARRRRGGRRRRRGARSGRRASTSTKSRTCGCSTTPTAPRA